MDNPETSSKPHLSAILDDTFYLLKLVINRVLSCGSLSTLNSMRREISTVVENDYAGVIKRKMEGVYAAQSGAGPEKGFERDRREKEQRQAFVVRYNGFPTLFQLTMITTSRSTPMTSTSPPTTRRG